MHSPYDMNSRTLRRSKKAIPVNPCPLCGAQLKAKEYYDVIRSPIGYPGEYLFRAWFDVQCKCFLSFGVQSLRVFETEDKGTGAVRVFFRKMEDHWNRKQSWIEVDKNQTEKGNEDGIRST